MMTASAFCALTLFVHPFLPLAPLLCLQIFVRSSQGPVSLDCESCDSIEGIKEKVSGVTGLQKLELAYNGRVLEDVCTLGDYSVESAATLEAYVPMLGGTPQAL